MLVLILCVDASDGIGYKGLLPWPHIKEDMRLFREITMGKDCIVGRKTAENLPLLKGRNLLIVSRSGLSVEEATRDDACVIGGASIYEMFVDKADIIIETRLNQSFHCDTFIGPKMKKALEREPVLSIDYEFGSINFYAKSSNGSLSSLSEWMTSS